MQANIIPVNGSDRSFTSHRYVLWFGAYGTTRLMVWADHLEDAFDESVDWIVDNAPGLLCDEQVNEAYQEAEARGLTHDEAFEDAMSDVSMGGNAGHCVLSYEWGIVAEDPTRAEVLAMQGR